MLKKIKILTSVLFLIIIISVSAQTAKPDFRDITFSRTGKEGLLNIYKVVYQGDSDISIMLEGVPGDAEKETIRVFADELLNWKGLTVRNVKFIFRKDTVEININPAALIFNDIDYASYLPAGITFIHTHYTMYDFRVVKDNYFIRIRGQYYGPDLLLGKVEEAVADPVKYIAVHDPEFMVKQISDINLKDTKQDGEIAQIKKELKELFDAHKKLSDDHLALQKDFEALRYAFVSITKKGIYGSKLPIPQKDIDAVLEIKSRKPAATVDEIYAETGAKGIKITKGKIAVIVNTYFSAY